MKGLMAQRLVLKIFMTLLLTFSIQGITDALIPDTTLRIVLLRRSEPTRKRTTIPIATKDDIAISEIMYATDPSGAPQWIELHNRNTRRISLEGWEITIENHPKDRSVFSPKFTFTLGKKTLNADGVLLLVTEQGNNSDAGSANGYLQADSVVILKDLIGGTQGYRLLSQTAFKITLIAPTAMETDRKMPSDIAGNLNATPEWILPLLERERSSIIRVYEGDDLSDGTTADGWEFASEKGYQYTRGIAYYGHHSDHGTPGYHEAAPLPVEFSHFRPARDKNTGTVVITWSTQSELNNTGFFIKRSQQRDGEPKILNATMIPGAGTTSEKHIYTYTDTTAQPNVVYYYQLECLSEDGTRRTLTRPMRLKGHVYGSRRFEEAPFWWKDFNR